MNILLWILAAVAISFALVAIVLFVYIKLQGEGDVRILAKDRGPLVCEYIDDKKAVFSMVIPFYNGGKQEDIILDAFARVLLPQEQFKLAKVTSRLERSGFRRDDNYLEAFIIRVEEKGEFILTLEIEAKEYDMKYVLENMVDITIDIYWTAVARQAPRICKDYLTVLLEEFPESAAKEVVGK